jgi:hypothetical protein
VYRRDSAQDVKLYYRLTIKSEKQAENAGCIIAEVDLERVGVGWKISRYGVS